MIRAMIEGLDQMAEDAFSRIRAQIPPYRQVTDKQTLIDIRAAVRRHASIALTSLQEQRRLHPDELTAMRANGAARSQQNLPLEALIDAARIGIQTGMDWAAKIAADLPDHDGVAAAVLSEIHQGFLDVFHDMTTVFRQGYVDNQATASARTTQRAEMFAEVLAGTYATEPEICALAARLGYDLNSPHGLVLFLSPAPGPQGFERAASSFAAAMPAAVETGHPGPGSVFVVPCASKDSWLKAVSAAEAVAQAHNLVALAGLAVSGPGPLAYSYRRICELASLALKVCGPRCVVSAQDLLVYQVIEAGGETVVAQLVDTVLGPVMALPDGPKKALLETIDAMHHNYRGVAAKRLGVSTKTIDRRWARIQQLTGLSLDLPTDRLRLDLALYGFRFLQYQ